MRSPISLLLSFGILACTGDKESVFSTGDGISNIAVDDSGETGLDTGPDIDTDTGPDTDTDTNSGEPSTEDAEFFDEPGDTILMDANEGVVDVDLTDLSGDSNSDQEYYLVLVNHSEEAIGYSLEYKVSSGEGNSTSDSNSGGGDGGDGRGDAGGDAGGEGQGEEAAQRPNLPPTSNNQQAKVALNAGRLSHISRVQTSSQAMVDPSSPVPPPIAEYSSTDIGVARQDFKVRDSLSDEESYEHIGATLWALGSSVSIWVDDSVAIDWDYDCNGTIDLPAQYEAYGFDNCDLENIATIADVNIFPNLRNAFGTESDMNSDSRVSVVITPVLNQMTRGEEDTDISLVGSYADPTVDLVGYDPEINPGSDEQEVIYVFAPDPYGFHNPAALTTIDDYTSVELNAQISSAFYKLISYNQHVIENEGEDEEAWVQLGMGALAADLTGFGASNFEMAWNYLDAIHLNPLVDTQESGAITTSSYGAQYLFFRWVADAYGESVLSSLVQCSEIGEANIESVMGETLQELVMKWQVAIMSEASTAGTGGLAVDSTIYPSYIPTSYISAPTTSVPSEGDFYGANGYQSGIDVGSRNYYMSNGLGLAVENADRRVVMSHSDHSTFVFGQDFFGNIAGGYATQVVRLTDIPFAAASLEVRSSSSDYSAIVIRASDPTSLNFSQEVVYSPTDVNSIVLPAVPNNGDSIYGIGELSQTGLTLTVDADGVEASEEIADTDRWLVDMSAFPAGQTVQVVAWLDHRYSDANGTVSPEDPWISIVPQAYLPVPTVSGTQQGSCAAGYSFGYPYMLLEHLYSQVFLSTTVYSETELFSYEIGDSGEEVVTDFDPCGVQEAITTTCDVDWDRDGVLDENEPTPETFLGQVQVMQCTLVGNDPSGFVPIDVNVIDVDERDEDDASTFDRRMNVGGVSAEDYEGAYLDITLTGGQQYILVVGGEGTGPYELTLRAITN